MDALVVVGSDEPAEHLVARARRRLDVAGAAETAALVADLRSHRPEAGVLAVFITMICAGPVIRTPAECCASSS